MSFIIGLSTDKDSDTFDVELLEISDENIRKISSVYDKCLPHLQQTMNTLKEKAKDKTYFEITCLPEFKLAHNEYVQQAAKLVENMCLNYDLKKSDIDFIVFYGERLDCKSTDKQDYSLQMGSGKMLADLTGIKVVYGIQTTTHENETAKNEVLFFSYLENLFKSIIGRPSNHLQAESNIAWIGTKIATRSIYRNEKYEYAEYEYDDMLNDTQMSVQERKKIAQYDAWKRRGNQGRFGR